MNNPRAALTMVAASLALLVTSGCATDAHRTPGDPFEPANRAIYKFNDVLDRTIAKPVAKGYQKVTPQPLRQAVTNFFSNLGDISNFANNLLQLKVTAATEDLMRVAMNTTLGIGGLIDFATPAGLPKNPQDFGLTLAHYGVPAGPYLVLPLFGPSDVRDAIGMGVDVKFNALNYFEPAARNPLWVLQFVSARANMLGATDLLQQAALDPYSFVRDAYRQQRASRLRGSSGAPALPNYGEPGQTTKGAGAAGGAGAGAGTGSSNGVPNYEDPGDAGGAAAQPAAGGNNSGLPDYQDPGAAGGTGAQPDAQPGAQPDATNGGSPGAADSPAAGKPNTAPSAQ